MRGPSDCNVRRERLPGMCAPSDCNARGGREIRTENSPRTRVLSGRAEPAERGTPGESRPGPRKLSTPIEGGWSWSGPLTP